MIEGEVKEVEEIETLAKLPSREELIAKLAGVLLANIQKLAVAVDQVAKQKGEGEEKEPETSEEANEEKVEKAEEEKEAETKEEEKEEK